MWLEGASMVLGPFASPKGYALRDVSSDRCALQDAPNNKIACRGETRQRRTHVGTRVGGTRAMRSPANAFLLVNPKMNFRETSSSCMPKTINSA